MSDNNDLLNIQHDLERHEDAVVQDAAKIAKLERAVALLAEALNTIDFNLMQGKWSTREGEELRDRYRAIVAELRRAYPATPTN
jgi:hypothetical protein